MSTPYEPTADDLALLAAAALWLSDGRDMGYTSHLGKDTFFAHGVGLLLEPFEGAMAFALMRRLRERGLYPSVSHGLCSPPHASAGAREASHPSSPLLALCRAMRDAGLLRTEPTIREVAQRVLDDGQWALEDTVRLARHVLATESER